MWQKHGMVVKKLIFNAGQAQKVIYKNIMYTTNTTEIEDLFTKRIQDLKQSFTAKYGTGDVSVFYSPGRINLIGEHTDYNGGFVFPCGYSIRHVLFNSKKQYG